MFRRKSFPSPSRNPLKHVLQHMHVYPLSNLQCFAELCQKLLSQGKTLTFVCVIGNVLPLTKQKGIFPDTLTIQDWSHQLDLTSFCRGCRKKKWHSVQQIIQNQTKPKHQHSQTLALSSTALSAAVLNQAQESRLPRYHLIQVLKTVQLVFSLPPRKQATINSSEVPYKILI